MAGESPDKADPQLREYFSIEQDWVVPRHFGPAVKAVELRDKVA
jgi:hypothetical protein